MYFKSIFAAACFIGLFNINTPGKHVVHDSFNKKISPLPNNDLGVGVLNKAVITIGRDTIIYEKELFISGNDTLPYRILYPEKYDPTKKYPLLVFLHGSGEAGNDNEAQLIHGSKLFTVDSNRIKFPAIVIFPQCPLKSWWGYYSSDSDSLNLRKPALAEQLLKALIDSFATNKIADKKRIYLGGLSMGGFGTYDMAIQYPHYFAALFPICGMANKQRYVKECKNTPIWIFHGELDDAVDVQPNRDLYKALKKAGAKNARYTEYKNVHHNSWENAFAEPGLLNWIFSMQL